jgi:hypothetical protein
VRVLRNVRRLLYGVGWALLTVLAGTAVWWGLRPLLAATDPVAKPGPSMAATAIPSQTGASAVPSAVPSSRPPVVGKPRSPSPSASSFDGWAFADGVFTRTFAAIGGTATIRIVNEKVELVSATPNSGYTTSVLPQDTPQRLVVRFDRPGGPASIIDAMWWLERPYAEVSEVK